MKFLRSTCLTLTIAAITASAAFAQDAQTPKTANPQTATPRIERREARQDARIRQGVRSGQLTRGETRRLEAGQRHVDRMEGRASADGVVTPRERARIGHAQNLQSRRIRRLKHNNITR